MFIQTVIGPYLLNAIHAGLKAGGNTAGVDGFGFLAIGDNLTVLTAWFKACNVNLLQAFFNSHAQAIFKYFYLKPNSNV